MQTQSEQDWREQPSKLDPFWLQIIAVVVIIVIAIFIGDQRVEEKESYWSNIYVSLLATVFTILVINRFANRRAVRQFKEQLVLNAGSIVNDVARDAIHQINKRGWLEGDNGLLAGADLTGANLQEAVLVNANLQQAVLVKTNLQQATLDFANLQGANLDKANLKSARLPMANLQDADLGFANLQQADCSHAKLQGAYLGRTQLQNADLSGANLQDATLEGAHLEQTNFSDGILLNVYFASARLQATVFHRANLRGAIFWGANLQGTDFRDASLINVNLGQGLSAAHFDDTTILPNWKPWTPDTEMEMFTNPQNENFWQSKWVSEIADK